MSRDPLYDLLEKNPGFVRERLSPVEQMSLIGRSLTVTSGVFDGILDANARRASGGVRLAARVGRILAGIARVLTPGGIEGPIFRHWLIVATFVDLFLIVFAVLRLIPAGFALTATAYTIIVAYVIEGARYVAQSNDGLRARARRLVAVTALLFFALFALALVLILHDEIRFGQAKHVRLVYDGLKAHGLQTGSFALGIVLLSVLGLVWGRLATQSRRGPLPWLRNAIASAAPLVLIFVLASTTTLVLPSSLQSGGAFLVGALVASGVLGLFLIAAAKTSQKQERGVRRPLSEAKAGQEGTADHPTVGGRTHAP